MDLYLKLLIYSPPGHGKTSMLGTVIGDPRLSPMLLIDFEAGVQSIRSKCRQVKLDQLGKVKPDLNKVDVVKVTTWDDFDLVHNFLAKGEHGYKTVGLDSVSEMNYMNLQEAIEDGKLKDSRHDPDVAEQRDYLRSATQMRRLIRCFRDLDLHTIFTCGSQEAQDPNTKLMQIRPALTGKLALEVPGLVDVVGYLAVSESEDKDGNAVVSRILLTQPTGKYMAKDRSEGGRLSPYLENPTLPKILDIIEGPKDESKTKGGNK